MSRLAHRGSAAERQAAAPVFAALGDETRLALIAKLSAGQRRSISQLARDSTISRQAITKHLRVLEQAGIVRSTRAGRESQFALDPQPIEDLRGYLARVSEHWDSALSRLQTFVER